MSATLETRLIDIVRASPKVMEVLGLVREANLPDWRLVAGSIYGTVWNALTGRPADYGIKDYDICY
ncbi:nucleotidyltransferase family protein, partial [Aquidulcibacter sp.]|uniref:nucleotidyltransferase family protein n=1 Tax=Aquidulcibacter sp. TaxID=2052990 RepID=UPI0025B7E546